MINATFDSRPLALQSEISNDWDPQIRAQHWAARLSTIDVVRTEFGDRDLDHKVAEFAALGVEPFSVVGYHNVYFRQVRRAFVGGDTYPALVGCCALGERILNHLIQDLREDYKSTPEYKTVYNKDSFDDWTRAIEVLDAWGVLLPEVVTGFHELRAIRNGAVHFRPELNQDARDQALSAIKTLSDIIERQFGAIGERPWYFGNGGETYIRGDAESEPFVRKFVVPTGTLVGPMYRLEFNFDAYQFEVIDVGDAGPSTGTDDEFLALRSSGSSAPIAASECGSDDERSVESPE
jgi:hypothetical protein